LADPDPDGEFHATPHFCLRRLGLIDLHRRGGQPYRLFAEAIERLSVVRTAMTVSTIRSEANIAGQLRILQLQLPVDPESSRAWRIAWDPIFFEFVKASRGALRFDLAIYRQLDPASRRLFLLLRKFSTATGHSVV